MKTIILLAATVVLSTALAKNEAGSQKVICTPTIEVGNLNYNDIKSGLNRIASIEASYADLGDDGFGIELKMTGTAGTGDKPAETSVKLPWTKAFASLTEYDNSQVSKSDLENPYIRFEIENKGDSKTFLGALTFSSVRDLNRRDLMTSRYNCEVK